VSDKLLQAWLYLGDLEHLQEHIAVIEGTTARYAVACPRCGAKQRMRCISSMTGDSGTHPERRVARQEHLDAAQFYANIVIVGRELNMSPSDVLSKLSEMKL